ncbi:hypothetical protein JKP88DRAFT_248999 [Tribonema minus]|uniref:Uncharacterized protein n=1 Tax=Tribonema minus TaxID=303371 RepID=A0A836CAB4_9STRA|nr:hypothetical protein JKP88DRAFT_248999 [Tribonema minus]
MALRIMQAVACSNTGTTVRAALTRQRTPWRAAPTQFLMRLYDDWGIVGPSTATVHRMLDTKKLAQAPKLWGAKGAGANRQRQDIAQCQWLRRCAAGARRISAALQPNENIGNYMVRARRRVQAVKMLYWQAAAQARNKGRKLPDLVECVAITLLERSLAGSFKQQHRCSNKPRFDLEEMHTVLERLERTAKLRERDKRASAAAVIPTWFGNCCSDSRYSNRGSSGPDTAGGRQQRRSDCLTLSLQSQVTGTAALRRSWNGAKQSQRAPRLKLTTRASVTTARRRRSACGWSARSPGPTTTRIRIGATQSDSHGGQSCGSSGWRHAVKATSTTCSTGTHSRAALTRRRCGRGVRLRCFGGRRYGRGVRLRCFSGRRCSLWRTPSSTLFWRAALRTRTGCAPTLFGGRRCGRGVRLCSLGGRRCSFVA